MLMTGSTPAPGPRAENGRPPEVAIMAGVRDTRRSCLTFTHGSTAVWTRRQSNLVTLRIRDPILDKVIEQFRGDRGPAPTGPDF